MEGPQDSDYVIEKDPITGFVHYGSLLNQGGLHFPWVKGFDGIKLQGQKIPSFSSSEEASVVGKEIYETSLVERALLERDGQYVSQVSLVLNVIFPSW